MMTSIFAHRSMVLRSLAAVPSMVFVGGGTRKDMAQEMMINEPDAADACEESISLESFIREVRTPTFERPRLKRDIRIRHATNAVTFVASVGALLAQYRIESEMSLREVAIAAGVAPRTIARLESAQDPQGPRIGTLQACLRAFGEPRLMFSLVGSTNAAREGLLRRGSRRLILSLNEAPNVVAATISLELREIAGISQSDVEAAIGKPNSFVSKIERGVLRNGVTMRTLYLVAAGCGVHLNAMDGGLVEMAEKRQRE